MKRFGTLMLVVLAAFAVVASDVDAKRIGGGGSMGAQRSIAPRSPSTSPSTPSGAADKPVMPSQPGATLPAKPATPAAAPAASGMSRWLGPIAGIAAGLGLAALLSHFGLSEGFASFLLIALLVVGGIFLVRMLLARRAPQRPAMQYGGQVDARTAPVNFDPQDWGGTRRQEPVIAKEPETPTPRPLPPGFDAVGFAKHAKQQFTRVQAAYDAGDRQAMSEVMTPEMFTEVERELSNRSEHKPTEVVSLNAGVLEVTTEGKQHWASVRYTGLLREDGDSTPKPIDEVWNLTKPVDGSSGWLLAGIQQTA